MAKYRLVGKTVQMMAMFILIFSASFILGDLSFAITKIFEMSGIYYDGSLIKSAVSVLVPIVGITVSLIVASTLKTGYENWFLMNAKGENAGMKALFFYFSLSGIRKSVSAFLYCSLKKISALTLFLFPSLCLFAVLYFSLSAGEISLLISYIFFGAASLLFVIGLVFYFIYSARFFAYYAIIVSNETIKPRDAFEKSVEITKDAYAKICFFRLSFLPWLMPCILILPIFYVWGYFKESKAMLCLKNEYLHS